MFDAITDSISDLWGTATDTVQSLWGPSEPAAPISVPVTAADEANARQMVDTADAWAAAGHTGSRGDEQQARNLADWKARDAGFADAQAQKDFREGSAAWDGALDAYLAGKGPSPGPRDEFIRKHTRGRE